MKILFLTHYYPPEGNAPATRVAAMAERWVKAGHEVTVVTGVPNVPNGVVYDGYANRIFPQRETVRGVEVIRVWTWLAPNKGTLLRIVNYVSYMLSAVARCVWMRRPDVLIATSPQFFCGWAGVLLKWWFRLTRPFSRRPRFILEIRDIWPESIGAVGAMSGGMLFRLLEFLELRMYAAANHIVTVGGGYRRRLVGRGVRQEDISIVTNGVDVSSLEVDVAAAGDFRKKWGLEGKFVCGYIGTIGMASGLSVYIRAAELLKKRRRDDIRLLAVGDGAVRAELEAEAKAKGLDNVVFTGRCEKGEVPGILGATDVSFVHLRRTPLFETVLPSKIFEAMGLARPILIGVEGDAKRLVLESGGGVAMEPENEEELVGRLEEMADSPRGELARMGENGLKYVSSHFDLDGLAAKYGGILATGHL